MTLSSDPLFHDPDFDDIRAALEINARNISADEVLKFEQYAAEMFRALGMNLDTPGTRETPRRFVRAMFDSTRGYDGDPKLLKVFPTECRGGEACHSSQIVEGPIHFYSLCE